MGKVRLECPHCGKAIRVSDTAKKAKCPGCKEVIEVAELMAKSGEEQPEEQAAAASAEEGDKVGVAPPSKKPSKRSSRRLKGASVRAPAKGPPKIAGLPSWIIVAGVSVVLFAVLFFFSRWWAALMIASAVGVYADASICRITRVGPGTPGSSLGPMIWGLLAFALVVGPVIYMILRPKLLRNSAEDIGRVDATDEDLEETGMVRAPSLASPGVVLVLAGAIGLGVIAPKPKTITIKLGRGYSDESRKVKGPDPRNTYDSKKPFHVVVNARKAFSDEYETLTYIIVPEDGDDENPTVKGTADWVVADTERKKTIWHWEAVVPEPGNYILKVMDKDEDVLIDTSFRIRSVN